MHPAFRLCRWNSLNAVHTTLPTQVVVCSGSFNLEYGVFDPTVFQVVFGYELGLPAFTSRVSFVHTQELSQEQTGFLPSCTGLEFHEGGEVSGFGGRDEEGGEGGFEAFGEGLLEGSVFFRGHGTHGRVWVVEEFRSFIDELL
jgi:hypothetical protein